MPTEAMVSATPDLSFSHTFGSHRRLRSSGRSRLCISGESKKVEQREKENRTDLKKKGRILANDSSIIPKWQSAKLDGAPPLVRALKAAAERNAASFNFPGHNRGLCAPSSMAQLIGERPFQHDLLAEPGLDNLFSPKGSLLAAQKQAAQLFGASETWFLVGGTTCGIQAAIMATCSPGDILILPRNAHASAISGMVFSGARPYYLIPDYDVEWGIGGGVTPLQVENAMKKLEREGQKAAAVFVTSPTYHGICSNLEEIAKVCHSRSIPLIVDEAHGAHFRFHKDMPSSALEQGADVVVQSTHKVLCSLTQSSMLHVSAGHLVDRERICRCLQALQSTSPNHLLLASLDAARAMLSGNPDTIFNKANDLAAEMRSLINRIRGVSVLGFPSFSNFPAMDPLRVSVGVWQLGLSGYQANDILIKEFGVLSELVGPRSITLAINLGTLAEHVARVESGLKYLSETFSIIQGMHCNVDDRHCFPFDDIRTRLSPREAFFARKRVVSVGESLGETCGELICPYPPGIPVMIPGELVTENALKYVLRVRRAGAVITGAADPLLSSIVVCNT